MSTLINHRFRRPVRQAGFSIIEFMVAMTIGLILMAGVITIFISSKTSYTVNTAVAQVQENGRFAFGFLRPVVRMAGYMGCTKFSHVSSILNSSFAFNFGQGIAGYEAGNTAPGDSYTMGTTPTTPWSPTVDTSVSTLGKPPLVGSDILVIYTTNGDPVSANVFNVNNATFQLQNQTPAQAGLYNGEVALMSNCIVADAFQITNMTGSQVQHSMNNTMVPGNKQTKFIDQFGANAQLVLPDSYIFYIGTGNDGSPSLYQADLNGGGGATLIPKELVSGVDNMQVLFGVDPTGSGSPAYYTTGDVVQNNGLWADVISVEIGLLVRSGTGAVSKPSTGTTYDVLGTKITAPADTRLRHVFTTVIGLRNRLP